MNNLKKIRNENKLSQSQLAELSGVSIRMIQKYETGDRDINNSSAITVIKLAKVLNVDVEDLLNEETQKRNIKTMTKEEMKNLKTVNENYKTFKDVFVFGFEEVTMKPCVHHGETITANRQEFAAGGKFEKFLDYPLNKFEEVFDVILSFC